MVAPFTKDINNNNFAVVFYRPAGSQEWQEGLAMSRDGIAREWRTSLIYLNPDTEYEIEVRYEDVDGVSEAPPTTTIRTRPNYPQIGETGVVKTVPVGGDLQTTLNNANPGDTIQLQSGTYNQSITLDSSHSGEPGRYITIEPAPGAKVIFDGSDPGVNGLSDNWTFYTSSPQGNIYYTDLPWGSKDCYPLQPGYVGELVQQQSNRYLLFINGSSSWTDDFLPAPAGKAFYVCNSTGPGPIRRLYVVTTSGDDPDNHNMQVALHKEAFKVSGADYLRIRGFEIRHYSEAGVRLSYDNSSGADFNIIENNIFHGIGIRHIAIEGKPGLGWVTNNLIQNNQLYEKGYRDRGWQWEIEYRHGRGGVVGIGFLNAGHGNIARNNYLESGHDGLVVSNQTSDIDIYNNTINECMDDGIEVDNNPGQNIRVWGNTINYCFVGISLQDWNGQSHGPVYIFRNIIIGGEDPKGRVDHIGGKEGYAAYTTFKVGSDLNSDSWVYIYHNTASLIRSSNSNGSGIADSGGIYFSNAVTRNNIWQISRWVFNLRRPTTAVNHNFDCDNLHDLNPGDNSFVQWSSNGGPTGNGTYNNLAHFQTYIQQELHGISDTRTIFNAALELQIGSPDIDAGCFITGFSDRGPQAYRGIAPDIGAFEFKP